ncbi:Indoleamine 2,3-dioxygenase 2 [Collichthys lucidus]|uniref:Indoleamine 2,3-dioxygenase 2 n=1 Tax=Collichthys lucidus TaxID=240159 RepID=A0A4U5VC94_COLLU|nr:Indoleamine 2,3-dioxygenase 2 [Collichthys lucidus]
METISRETLEAAFDAFDISENLGFLLKEPLTTLPDYYRVWLDLANNLTHLIESRKLRDQVHKVRMSKAFIMQTLNAIKTHACHCGHTVSFVESLMVILITIQMPVLSPDLLSNHRELRLAHLALGFIIMGYVWQEGQHAPAQGTLEVMHAMKMSDLTGIQKGLIKVTQSLKKMKETFKLMHKAFLTRMRDYMLPAHHQLIQTLCVCPSLRDFILSHSSSDLCQAYNSCVSALVDFRNFHLNSVTKYIIVPGNHARAVGCPLRGVGSALNNTGTGGSNLMGFLRSVRDTTRKTMILKVPSESQDTEI